MGFKEDYEKTCKDVFAELEKTMASLMDKIDFHLKRRAGKGIWIEAMVFSNQYGLLGKTTAADRLIKTLLEDG